MLLPPPGRHPPLGLDPDPEPGRHHHRPQPRRLQGPAKPRPTRPHRVTTPGAHAPSRVPRGRDEVRGPVALYLWPIWTFLAPRPARFTRAARSPHFQGLRSGHRMVSARLGGMNPTTTRAACGDRGRRDRRAGGSALPARRAGPGDGARGVAAAGRQAVRIRGGRGRGRRGGRGAPHHPPRGHRPHRRGGAGRRARGAGDHLLGDLDARRAAAAAPPAVHGRAVRPGRAGPDRRGVRRRSRPRRADLELPPTARDGDVPVAQYVGARLGAEVVDRLVDPLLGGVYAGRSAELSFDATMPALSAASRRHRSLAEAVGSLLPPPARLRPGTRTRCRPARGPADRCSPPSPGDWACCPPTWPRPPGPRSGPARWRGSCPRRPLRAPAPAGG